jgi:riboflavin transporter FmnP
MTYAGLGAIFGIKGNTMNELVIPLIAGAVGADFLTWIIRSIFLFPLFLKHGVFDAIVSVAFGWLIFAVFGLGIRFDSGEDMATAFLSFLAVLAMKVAYYSIEYIEEDSED